MAFGTEGDIQRFWDAVDNAEAKTWVAESEEELVPAEVECADGSWRAVWAPADIEDRIDVLDRPTSRLRILNPFDPVIRDRDRLNRLFGFEYTVEMFVPAAKRRWGYYVYPLLEGDRFVGRIEVKGDRKAGELKVINFWPEPKVKWSDARYEKLHSELARFAKLANCKEVVWET